MSAVLPSVITRIHSSNRFCEMAAFSICRTQVFSSVSGLRSSDEGLNQIANNVVIEALMTGREYNSEDERPFARASARPSDRLVDRDKSRKRNHHQERLSQVRKGYPRGPADDENRCRSCGTSIPVNKTKCQFCSTADSDHFPSDATDAAPETRIIGVIHFLVESSTSYGAVAKGGAAAKLLCKSDAFPAVHKYQLIYDLDDRPASQLTDPWPVLPEVAKISTDEGQQLLVAIRDHLRKDGTESKWVADHDLSTCLYDESGDGIHNEGRLEELLKSTGNNAWVVPAIAFKRATNARMQHDQNKSGPTTEQLDCIHCKTTTEHEFRTYESIPAEEFSDQAIWECQECCGCHYGPNPK